MSTIYLITEGSYSDYHVVAAYSTQELAEETQKHRPGSVIEEYKLDEPLTEHPPGHYAWIVNINPDDEKIVSSYQTSTSIYFEPTETYYDGGKTYRNKKVYPPSYCVQCWARDKEHAEKIALDKFYQFKAQQAGL